MPVRYLSVLPSSADLVIVGGGIVGAATAFYAARAGLQPILVERRPRPCSLTTPAATGGFRLQFDNEEELALVRQSVELFLNFAEITDQDEYDVGVRQQGYLWLTTGEDGAERQRGLVDLQHGWGQTDVELLSGETVRKRFPYVSERVIQGRFRQGDGFLDTKQLTMGLLAASGAPILTDCAVTGFQIRGGRLTGLETARGAVSVGAAVIACGPFSGLVAARAGVSLPVTTVVRHKLAVPLAPQIPADAPMTIDDDTGAHWRPALGGAYILFTDPSTPPSPPTEDVTPSYRFIAQVMDPSSPTSVARIAPFWSAIWERNTAHWFLQGGQYTMTPDHRPLIGETTVEGLFVNTGYSGHGVMAGPAGSRMLVDLLTGRLAGPANPFRLDRVFTHRDLDVL